MVVKTSPGAAFEMVQAQIGFGPLEKLFNLPATTAQSQTASSGGRLMKVGDVVTIGVWVLFRPVHHQPVFFHASLPEVGLQVKLRPSQAGGAGLSRGRGPLTLLPFPWANLGRQLDQRLGGRSIFVDMIVPLLETTLDRLPPAFVFAGSHLQKVLQLVLTQ